MRKFTIIVEQEVTVELDETKFDEDFMQEFRDGFYPFFELRDHAEHIAQLQARGVVDADQFSGCFIEGYGQTKLMGIKASSSVVDTQIIAATPDEVTNG